MDQDLRQWRIDLALVGGYLAQKRGLVVVAVDGRGFGGRGSGLRSVPYLPDRYLGSQDQIEAAQALDKRTYVNTSSRRDRYIWLELLAGYMTLMTILVTLLLVWRWHLHHRLGSMTLYAGAVYAGPQENLRAIAGPLSPLCG